MSTRCQVIIKDDFEAISMYRHSDGYPDCAGADLIEFVADYTSGAMRTNASQSAGWLVLRGAVEYSDGKPLVANASSRPEGYYSSWKVGAYEPCSTELHGDIEYLYIIDLEKRELTCRQPKSGFWDDASIKNTVACKSFKKVSF